MTSIAGLMTWFGICASVSATFTGNADLHDRCDLHSFLCRNEAARYRSQDPSVLHQSAAICGVVCSHYDDYHMFRASSPLKFVGPQPAYALTVQRVQGLPERTLEFGDIHNYLPSICSLPRAVHWLPNLEAYTSRARGSDGLLLRPCRDRGGRRG